MRSANTKRGPEAQSANPNFSLLNTQPEAEVFTNFGDVKSARISWTAERQAQLRTMWERGDKAPVIAAAFGCKPSAIAVARARFGLKPRRSVSGRPKQEPDEPAHKIDRVAFTTSRLMEFCTEKELVAQTGHEAHEWLRVLIKELIDNGIDACEEAERPPVVKVTVTTGKKSRSKSKPAQPTRIVIADNGPGIPPNIITGIIDYNVRVSSREAYISPTRGRQGNALKTILPMSYVLGGKNETVIEARGVKHRIRFSVNQIKQEPIVRNTRSRSPVKTGTRVTVLWPAESDADFDAEEISSLLMQFVWFNPHLTLHYVVNGKTLIRHVASKLNWTKYKACVATSAHWYSLEQFERYAGALIARDQEQRRGGRKKYTVREFIAQFRGLSGTDKQKVILRELGAAHMTLHAFFGSEEHVHHQRMEKLLLLLQQQTRPVRPELLGVIGEEHFRKLTTELGGEPKAFKYFAKADFNNGVPYVVEIAISPYTNWVAGKYEGRHRELITGVNFSATLENPFNTLRGLESMDEMLESLRAGEYAPVIVAVHYACPHIVKRLPNLTLYRRPILTPSGGVFWR